MPLPRFDCKASTCSCVGDSKLCAQRPVQNSPHPGVSRNADVTLQTLVSVCPLERRQQSGDPQEKTPGLEGGDRGFQAERRKAWAAHAPHEERASGRAPARWGARGRFDRRPADSRVLRRVTCRRLADSVGRKGWAQRPRPTTSIGPCRAHHLQLSPWRDLCRELVTVGGQAWRWPWQRRSSWKNSPVSLKRGTPPKRS